MVQWTMRRTLKSRMGRTSDWIKGKLTPGVTLISYIRILLLTSLQDEEETSCYAHLITIRVTHSTSTSTLHYSEELIHVRSSRFLCFFLFSFHFSSSCNIELYSLLYLTLFPFLPISCFMFSYCHFISDIDLYEISISLIMRQYYFQFESLLFIISLSTFNYCLSFSRTLTLSRILTIYLCSRPCLARLCYSDYDPFYDLDNVIRFFSCSYLFQTLNYQCEECTMSALREMTVKMRILRLMTLWLATSKWLKIGLRKFFDEFSFFKSSSTPSQTSNLIMFPAPPCFNSYYRLYH